MSKGSAPRPFSVSRTAYEDNWKATFGRKRKLADEQCTCDDGCGMRCFNCCLRTVKEKAKLEQDDDA